MPKTNINDILKKGAETKLPTVDFSTPQKRRELKKAANKAEQILNSKYISLEQLDSWVATK